MTKKNKKNRKAEISEKKEKMFILRKGVKFKKERIKGCDFNERK